MVNRITLLPALKRKKGREQQGCGVRVENNKNWPNDTDRNRTPCERATAAGTEETGQKGPKERKTTQTGRKNRPAPSYSATTDTREENESRELSLGSFQMARNRTGTGVVLELKWAPELERGLEPGLPCAITGSHRAPSVLKRQ